MLMLITNMYTDQREWWFATIIEVTCTTITTVNNSKSNIFNMHKKLGNDNVPCL